MLSYGFESFQGIFISRVIKEGASEKAGIHVGDRLVEVGSLDYFLLYIHYGLWNNRV